MTGPAPDGAPAGAAPPVATGLQHVALGIDEVGATRAFYGALGLEEIPRPFPPGPIEGMWWRLPDGTMVHMIVRSTAPGIVLEHFALQVPDLDRAVAAMEAAGFEVSRRPHDPGAGHQAFVTDPAGNLVELNQVDGLYHG